MFWVLFYYLIDRLHGDSIMACSCCTRSSEFPSCKNQLIWCGNSDSATRTTLEMRYCIIFYQLKILEKFTSVNPVSVILYSGSRVTKWAKNPAKWSYRFLTIGTLQLWVFWVPSSEDNWNAALVLRKKKSASDTLMVCVRPWQRDEKERRGKGEWIIQTLKHWGAFFLHKIRYCNVNKILFRDSKCLELDWCPSAALGHVLVSLWTHLDSVEEAALLCLKSCSPRPGHMGFRVSVSPLLGP